MPNPLVLNVVHDWFRKHGIENVSDYAKADLASMIDAFARKSNESTAEAGRSKRSGATSTPKLPSA